MARMKIENLDFEESYDIQRRRKVRMAEIANARQSSIAEDDSPFSKENMKNATKKQGCECERASERIYKT